MAKERSHEHLEKLLRQAEALPEHYKNMWLQMEEIRKIQQEQGSYWFRQSNTLDDQLEENIATENSLRRDLDASGRKHEATSAELEKLQVQLQTAEKEAQKWQSRCEKAASGSIRDQDLDRLHKDKADINMTTRSDKAIGKEKDPKGVSLPALGPGQARHTASSNHSTRFPPIANKPRNTEYAQAAASKVAAASQQRNPGTGRSSQSDADEPSSESDDNCGLEQGQKRKLPQGEGGEEGSATKTPRKIILRRTLRLP
jgi:hypothetical protein